MPDIPRRLVDELSGLMIAADLPERYIEAGMAGKIEPVRIVMHDHRTGDIFELPVRPITSHEAVMLINRFLQEGKLEFGFRPKERSYGGPIA